MAKVKIIFGFCLQRNKKLIDLTIFFFAISGITMYTPLKEHGADKGGLVVGIMGMLNIENYYYFVN